VEVCKIVKDEADVIQGVRAKLVASHLDLIPRRQLGVDVSHEVLYEGFQLHDLFGDINVVLLGVLFEVRDLRFDFGDGSLKFEYVSSHSMGLLFRGVRSGIQESGGSGVKSKIVGADGFSWLLNPSS
jgi:hypothetical protein